MLQQQRKDMVRLETEVNDLRDDQFEKMTRQDAWVEGLLDRLKAVEEETERRKEVEANRNMEMARMSKERVEIQATLTEARRELAIGRGDITQIVEDKDNQIKSIMHAMEIFKSQYNKQ